MWILEDAGVRPGCRPDSAVSAGCRSALDLAPVAAPEGVEGAVAVDAVVGVCAEVVALALGEGGGEAFGAQRVVVGEGGGEGGGGDALGDGGGDHAAPVVLCRGDLLGEALVGEEARHPGLRLVGAGDPVEESGPDDASAAPDRGDPAEVDVPVVLLAARRDLVEALGVGDDLRGVQRLLDLVGEGRRLVLAEWAGGRPGQVA